MSDAGSNPFVGLRAFESEESLLFFGRQQQTRDLLQRLHDHHFVAVVGSSGSGKSSIIKAGLIPALKAGYLVVDRDSWMISVMKPGQSPLCNLAEAVLKHMGDAPGMSSTELEQKIREEGADALLQLLKPLWGSTKNFFLLVDQFEELFRFSLDSREAGSKDEAIDFVNILLELSSYKELPIYTVITMRSDFIGDCSLFFGLPEAINKSQYLVPRLNRVQLKSAIEGPVRLSNGIITKGLLIRLLNDSEIVKDELPLLQHALMRIWDRNHGFDDNGQLDVEDYENIGGLEKALSNHADEALLGMQPRELILTKRIFQALTTVDRSERKVRRPVRLSDLMAVTGATGNELMAIIDRFAEAGRSFLIVSEVKDKHDVLIDISHESLIRQWRALNEWVNEETESAKVLLRLDESAQLYTKKEKNLLTGNELNLMLHWNKTFYPTAAWAKRYDADFELAVSYLKQSEKEVKRERLKRKRNRVIASVLVLLALVFVSIFAYFVYSSGVRQKRELAINYWKSSLALKNSNQLLEALQYLAESLIITDDPGQRADLFIDAEASLPLTSLAGVYGVNYIINDVQFNTAGNTLLAALNNGSALLIDQGSGRVKATLPHEKPVNSAIFSGNGNYVLTCTNNREAILWDANTYAKKKVFAHPAGVNNAVFSVDDTSILTAGADSSVRIWDIATGLAIFTIHATAPVVSISVNDAQNTFLVLCADNTVTVYDLTSKKQSCIIRSENAIVSAATWSPEGKVVTCSNDLTIKFYDVPSCSLTQSFHHDAISSRLLFSKDGKWLATAGKDGNVRLLNAFTGIQQGAVMRHDGPVYGISFSADGKQLATGGWDKTLRVWQLSVQNNQPRATFFNHNGIVSSAAYSNSEQYIITASNDSAARIFSVANSQMQSVLKHRSYVHTAVFSGDDKLVLTASDDSTAKIWSSKGALLQTLVHPVAVISAAFNSNGTRVVTASADQVVRIWDHTTPVAACTDSFRQKAFVYSAVFNPEGNRVLIACADSSAYIVNLSGGLMMSFKHDDIVRSAVFNNDGSTVLTAGWDATARLWDAATGRQTGPSMKHNAYLNSATFGPGEKSIITSGWDKSAHIWNVLTRQQTGKTIKQSNAINTAVISANGQYVLTSSRDSTAAIWPVSGDLDLPPRLFYLQAQVISGVKFNMATDDARCLAPAEWLRLSGNYEKQASAHYKICKFPEVNFWRRFHTKQAEALRTFPAKDR